MAEWLKALVLKTSRGFRSLVGSNPTPSASTPFATVRRHSFQTREDVLIQQCILVLCLYTFAIIRHNSRIIS
jgi:hypothetical protein